MRGMKNVLFAPKEGWARRIQETVDPAKFRVAFQEFGDPDVALDDFDCVVPLRLQDYRPLRTRPINGRANFLIPGEPVVALTDDKSRMNEFLLTNGFEEFVPEIYGEQVAYPFIYKKRRDEWGAYSRIIRSPEEKRDLEKIITQDDYFKQEYVCGNIEYVTHILAMEGRLRYVLTYEHTFDSEYFIKGKWANYRSWRKIDTPFIEVFVSILENLNFTGTCCFNFKLANGVPKIFEMNSRYGATLTLEVNAYLDAYLDALAA